MAQYRLGTLYERGQGVPANAAKAAHWYEMAANQGNRKAMHNLAVSDASGTAGKKNMPEAARWFAKAAALGLADSQFNLAVLYERGDGVPQSLLDAYKWYSIAAGLRRQRNPSRAWARCRASFDDYRQGRRQEIGRDLPCCAAEPRGQCAARNRRPRQLIPNKTRGILVAG